MTELRSVSPPLALHVFLDAKIHERGNELAGRHTYSGIVQEGGRLFRKWVGGGEGCNKTHARKGSDGYRERLMNVGREELQLQVAPVSNT